ncbi:MAG TPA: transglycosylase SLT domain-containing protein [Thermoanaerobaculia bacterium]|nr:transglycosylase SLT domain-containing protein [Thermoanaerobaculia bacterium]
MTRKQRIIAVIAAAVLVLAVLFWFGLRARPERRTVLDAATGTAPLPPAPPLSKLSVGKWTPRFIEIQRAGEWALFQSELESLRKSHPSEFEKYRLGYLLARVLLEQGEWESAREELVPFLLPDNPFAPLARRHDITIAEGLGSAGEAARLRQSYIRDFPDSPWRGEQIEAQLQYLQAEDPPGLIRFAESIRSGAPTSLRRDLDARQASALASMGREKQTMAIALRLLRGGTADDPAERAFQLLDRPAIIASLSTDDLILVGESARNHRHFDRSVELLTEARARAPRARAGDLLFAVGRSHFGSEQFDKAEEAYLAGAVAASSAEQKATFYFHAARAAQLGGDDDRAVRHMTRAIAVPGRFGSTSAAITQRMRTRFQQGSIDTGLTDLRQVERLFPRGESRVEARMHAAAYLLAAGRASQALSVLDEIPGNLATAWDRAEIGYWRARALEGSDPEAAVDHYLRVLRADVPTHFSFFARERLGEAALRVARAERLRELREAATAARTAGEWETARGRATDVFLLSGTQEDLELLRQIYRELPGYREILELEPEALPSLPIEEEDPGRNDLLMAMGLFDETVETIETSWGLRPMKAALTRSHALNLAGASRESIYAVEVMMRSVPDDYVPQLLPRRALELLYPRYFLEIIEEDAERYGADPRLVIAIMREESRFNPRAKSVAAARGLLQFIITTARDIGQSLGLRDLDSRDLYDPRTIIQLGAKYVADLLEEFEGDPYRAAAAYNAGPFQTRLWSRLQPAPGQDYFLTTVNFSETKHYVRKVLNSYERYGEIYEGLGATGGTRAEP